MKLSENELKALAWWGKLSSSEQKRLYEKYSPDVALWADKPNSVEVLGMWEENVAGKIQNKNIPIFDAVYLTAVIISFLIGLCAGYNLRNDELILPVKQDFTTSKKIQK